MLSKEQKIEKLEEFIKRDKFSEEAWNQRGLLPSSDEMSQELSAFFNATAQKLIKNIEKNSASKTLQKTFNSQLATLEKDDFDTEENEFVCDLLYELASLVEVEISEDLNNWLYGSTLDTISYLQEMFESQKKVEIIEQVCTKCSSMIEFIIKDIDDHTAQTDWLVAECVTCLELNLIPTGKNIRLQNYGTYLVKEQLDGKDYNQHQAIQYLEQLKKSPK